MYRLRLSVSAEFASQLSDYYLELGATSVSVVESEGMSSDLELWILAETVAWFKSVGITQKPVRLKKSEWEYQYESTLTSHPFIAGWAICSESYYLQGQWDSKTIVMDMRGAFGDGVHPTTRVSAQFLERLILTHSVHSVADLGAGTGVLGIMAAKMGVPSVDAFDIDPISVKRIRKNVTLNHVCILAKKADVLAFKPSRQYDCVVANLHSSLISKALPLLKTWISPNGYLILSGIAETWHAEFVDLFQRNGWMVLDDQILEHWCGFILQAFDI